MNPIRRIGLAAGLLVLGALAAPQQSAASPLAPAGVRAAETGLTQHAGWRHRQNGHHRPYWRYRDHWRNRYYWKHCRHDHWGYRCNWRSPR